MKRILKPCKWSPAICLSLIVVLVNCGAPRQTVNQNDVDSADVDMLLGLTDEETTAAKENSGQEEVKKTDDLLEQDFWKAYYDDEKQEKPKTDADSTAFDDKIARLDADEASGTDVEVSEIPPGTAGIDRSKEISWVSTTYEGRYREALNLYYDRKYRDAIPMFEALLHQRTDHLLAVNCQYWIGESYYGLGNYAQAIVAFEKVFTFSRNHKDDDAQLKLGICYFRSGNKDRARQEFQKLLDAYPDSEYVSRARAFLDQLN